MYHARALHERDLDSSSLETPRDENYARNAVDIGDADDTPSKGMGAVRRSFSWGKKKKGRARDKLPEPVTISSEARVVMLDRIQADNEIGFDMHLVTGDVIVSYVSESLAEAEGIEVSECVLAIQGIQLVDGGEDALEGARYILREPGDSVELILQKHVVRTEVLKRHAALKGTSLDKLGLTLQQEGEMIVIKEVDGLAAKSKRFSTGDKVIAINGTRTTDLNQAVELLKKAAEEHLETELELLYGFDAPPEYEFDAESGLYMPARASQAGSAKTGGFAAVKRTLSFGKRKKAALQSSAPKGKATSSRFARGPSKGTPPPVLNLEPRLLDIPKNDAGMIQVTFKAHAVTNELIIGLVGEGSPAQLAGVEVGDAVLALQGNMIESDGEFALDDARSILQQTSHFRTVELMVQSRVRTETLEFAAKEPGAPRNYLGLSFYSFPDDLAVRVVGVSGPAAKAGRIAIGDRIVSVNGVRVNHAETLSAHIGALARTHDYVTFEVALGYAAGEGVWYGGDAEHKDGDAPRKAKRSFSFGRKPRH